jgi:hypothetical protein
LRVRINGENPCAILTLPAKQQHSPSCSRDATEPPRQPVLSTRTLRTRIVRMLRHGQRVRVNLASMRVGSVVFHAAVTDAVGTIVREVSADPPIYLVKLLFSFHGVDEVEVPEGRILAK